MYDRVELGVFQSLANTPTGGMMGRLGNWSKQIWVETVHFSGWKLVGLITNLLS